MTTAGQRCVHDPDGLNTGAWPVPPDEFITPTDNFFTRSHARIPDIDPQSWRLEVGGLVDRPRRFSLKELTRGFPERNVPATLVCAGLRRTELLSLGPIPGEFPWGPEPVSTGRWTGIALRSVLQTVGVAAGARHVEFIGLDRVERQGEVFGFGGSINLDKALGEEVLLATGLNGAPLPPVHGFPMRAVVPGWIGARSVKWLGRIVLRADPSPNYFQSRAYRIQREANPNDPRDVSAGIAIGAVPLNAVILEPTANQVVRAGPVTARGWAMGCGGHAIDLVEVSSDSGQNWKRARIAIEGEAWTWSLWEATMELSRGRHTLVVRATDAEGTTQPSTVNATWNVKGYSNNAWHRVTVRAE
jgi:sulfite oxidase